MKPFLIILGFLTAALLIAQLTMGLLLASSHNPKLVTPHQHTGYLTVAVSLTYVLLSQLAIASMPRRQKP